MQLRSLLFVTVLIPVVALGQGSVKLDYGSTGEREVWISDKVALPASTMKVLSATHDLPIPTGKNDKLFIWDRKTGNVAIRAVSLLRGGSTWKLAPEDFTLIGKVTVRVEHEGDRVAVAFVNVKSGGESQESQIDPKKNGEAEFFGLKQGNVQVTVRYNSNGQDADPAQQSFILNAKRAESDPTLIVSLAQPVETVKGSAPVSGTTTTANGEPQTTGQGKETPSGDPAKPAAKPPSIIGSILTYLIALGAAGAAIWFGLRYLKDNQDKVKDQLQKVGVQVPDPLDPAQQDPGPAPVPIAPAPPQKILLDDADPNVPAAPIAPTPTAQGPTPGFPSLVMGNGDIFPIPDGETSVGREAGNGLALVTESTVSRRHATIVKNGPEISVRDEGSSNGTYVNGVKIASATVLRPGDQVQFGQVQFRYEA